MMSRSEIKLDKSKLPAFSRWLGENGYEINDTEVEWRHLMFRCNERAWTQCYDGLTCQAKKPREFLRVFGPEEQAVEKFLDAKSQDK